MDQSFESRPLEARGEVDRLLSGHEKLRAVIAQAEALHRDRSRDHTLEAPFPMVQPLTRGLTACLVWPGVDPEVVRGGLHVCHSAFGDEHIDERMGATYGRTLQRDTVLRVDDAASSDFGRELENSGFFVYCQKGEPVGISGLYRYLDQPEVFWLGRLGIAGGRQGQGLGRVVAEHLAGLAASLGGICLKAYTEEEGPTAAEVHRFYERAGFTRAAESFIDEGCLQRVYQILLPR